MCVSKERKRMGRKKERKREDVKTGPEEKYRVGGMAIKRQTYGTLFKNVAIYELETFNISSYSFRP